MSDHRFTRFRRTSIRRSRRKAPRIGRSALPTDRPAGWVGIPTIGALPVLVQERTETVEEFVTLPPPTQFGEVEVTAPTSELPQLGLPLPPIIDMPTQADMLTGASRRIHQIRETRTRPHLLHQRRRRKRDKRDCCRNRQAENRLPPRKGMNAGSAHATECEPPTRTLRS